MDSNLNEDIKVIYDDTLHKQLVTNDDITKIEYKNCNTLIFKHIGRFSNLHEINISSVSSLKLLHELNYCENLQKLTLIHCNLSNLTWINRCENIVEFYCNNNNIVSLNGLQGCKKIHILDISSNHVKNIKQLKFLRELKILDCSNNAIKSLSPLINCWNLEDLNIKNNNIINLNGLENCIRLNKLICDDLIQSKFHNEFHLFNTLDPMIPWRFVHNGTYKYKKLYLYMDRYFLNRHIHLLNGNIDFLMNYRREVFMTTNYYKRNKKKIIEKYIGSLDNNPKANNKVTTITI